MTTKLHARMHPSIDTDVSYSYYDGVSIPTYVRIRSQIVSTRTYVCNHIRSVRTYVNIDIAHIRSIVRTYVRTFIYIEFGFIYIAYRQGPPSGPNATRQRHAIIVCSSAAAHRYTRRIDVGAALPPLTNKSDKRC